MRLTTLLPDHFLTVSEFRQLTEFPMVSTKTDAQLGLYLTRTQVLLWEWLPFEDRGMESDFLAQMKLATFMIAESLALANVARPAAAAGYSSETIGKYSYSRAPGGGSSGQGIKVDLVPDEALAILERWSANGSGDYSAISTTEVFGQASADANGIRVFAMGDDLTLSTLADPPRGPLG